MVEAAFREILKSHFPHIKFHGDEEDDDICVRASGVYWECERLFYNRSTEQIRMWRWKGQCDYYFTSDGEFIHWLSKHVSAGHKFEEIEKPKPPRKSKPMGKEFTAVEHYYVLALEPARSNQQYKGIRYWAKAHDFAFTDITHATRFDSIKAAQAVRTKASEKYKKAPWFGITEDDIMFIAEIHTDVPVKQVINA